MNARIGAPPTRKKQSNINAHKRTISDAQRTRHMSDWKPTKKENPDFTCRECGSDDVWYYIWESSCGGFEDYKYHCRGCDRRWVIEGPDA